jgi:hypothetical protein
VRIVAVMFVNVAASEDSQGFVHCIRTLRPFAAELYKEKMALLLLSVPDSGRPHSLALLLPQAVPATINRPIPRVRRSFLYDSELRTTIPISFAKSLVYSSSITDGNTSLVRASREKDPWFIPQANLCVST